MRLVPGIYSVNATIEVPAHGVVRGEGRDSLGSPYVTTIAAVGALPAVIASAGWAENTNTSGLNGTDLSHFTVDGNGTAANGIILQTFDGRVDNVSVMNTTWGGITWCTLSDNQEVAIGSTINLSNNRVTNCVVSNCAGPGIGTSESSTSDTYTDGYCMFNIVANCGTGIFIQQSADWLVLGNHVYAVQTHGMVLGDMWNTKVIGNQIDQWGQSTSENVYRAIDGFQYPSWGGMNVLMGNVIDVMDAPGNSASSLEGMKLACQGSAGCVATWTVTGNNLQCEPGHGHIHLCRPARGHEHGRHERHQPGQHREPGDRELVNEGLGDRAERRDDQPHDGDLASGRTATPAWPRPWPRPAAWAATRRPARPRRCSRGCTTARSRPGRGRARPRAGRSSRSAGR